MLATIHVVWFYVNRIPSYLNLERFEYGQERMPFQSRILLMLPLRWAHNSSWLRACAYTMSQMYAWFPKGVRPEGLLEAAIDIASVTSAGIVATLLSRAASRTQVFTAYIYPLVLVMVVESYSLLTMHHFRFVYDLPSLGLFSVGLYLIYFRRSTVLFCSVFVLATINRETSLLLLPLILLTELHRNQNGSSAITLKTLLNRRLLSTIVPLSLFWLSWHIGVGNHFRSNPSESHPRLAGNFFLLLWPVVWPQIAGVGAYSLPLLVLFWRGISDPIFRSWRWILPFWIMITMFYGIIFEIRLFGELIPVFACAAALMRNNA